MVQVLQIQEQVLDPERGALAHGGGLGRLEVREPEGGLVLPLGREGRQGGEHVLQAAAQEHQGLLHDEQVAVIGDEAAGGPKVDDGPRRWRLLAPGVNGGHDIVAQGGLVARDGLEIHVVLGGPQLHDLRRCDRQAQLGFRLGQGNPEAPPHPLAVERREQAHHGLAGVAAGQRMLEALQFGAIVGGQEGHGISDPSVSHGPRTCDPAHEEGSLTTPLRG